ncbi:MAG: MFS transporter [Steroidobacteraceae bacterium]|jgi:MFS family permease|nr:MFS transporter [Steroidobacteraceae bacterium]
MQPAQGEDADYPDRRRAWWLVLVLALAGVVSVIDRTLLSVVVDPVRADLGLSEVQIGLLQGLAFGLFYATVGVPLGLMVDRHSRRLIVIGGVGLWSAATLASGFAQSFGELFAARLLVGLGEAALSPAAISAIADLFPPRARGRPVSVFLLGQALASGLGISVASLIADAAEAQRFAGLPVLAGLAPWRAVFVVCGVLGFGVVLAMLSTAEPRRRVDATRGSGLAQVRASLGFLWRHGSIFVPLYLGFASCFLASYGAAAWHPAMLLRAFEVTRADLAAVLGPMKLVFSAIGPVIGGLLVDRAMRRGDPLARFRILALAPLFVLPLGLATFAPGPMSAMFLVALGPTAVAAIGTTMLALLQSTVPADMRGFAVALTGFVNTFLAAALGPLLISVLTERVFGDPRLVGWSVTLVVVPALLGGTALFLVARRAVQRRVQDGSAPETLMVEMRNAAATMAAGRAPAAQRSSSSFSR